MKWINLVFFLLFTVQNNCAQHVPFADNLYQNYETFREETIQQRQFQHSDIEPLVTQLDSHPAFEVTVAGHSVEDRPIYLIRVGEGDTNVLFWSQMHGDESTATMALFDIFNFFSRDSGPFADKREQLLDEVSLYFLPMLNPDGAERFRRRNVLDIDINRDALRLTSPASQILKSVRDSLNPTFGFNLHDQSSYYSAGRSPEPATLSFLAPAYDFEQSENKIRTDAMRLIGYLNTMLQQYIPGKVAKYSDAHEPRAFGDMIQKWGTSTVLIESGGYPDDPEKQYIRKLNFITLLTAVDAIADQRYSDTPKESYYQIPENNRSLTDLLIREVRMVYDDQRYLVDIGITRQREVIDSESYYRASISGFGDLSTSHGYQELDAGGMEVHPGNIYPDTLKNRQEAEQLPFEELLKKGYTDIVVEEVPRGSYLTDIPLNIIARQGHSNRVGLGSRPNLILKENGDIRYVIVNGYLYDTREDQPGAIENTLILK
ncbi:MAG TPA: M14 family zinc carboxypeptidase [Fodinibius sp.]|nr:M14 family zinc carboxypeptidase [Fodinibius sp.]